MCLSHLYPMFPPCQLLLTMLFLFSRSSSKLPLLHVWLWFCMAVSYWSKNIHFLNCLTCDVCRKSGKEHQKETEHLCSNIPFKFLRFQRDLFMYVRYQQSLEFRPLQLIWSWSFTTTWSAVGSMYRLTEYLLIAQANAAQMVLQTPQCLRKDLTCSCISKLMPRRWLSRRVCLTTRRRKPCTRSLS